MPNCQRELKTHAKLQGAEYQQLRFYLLGACRSRKSSDENAQTHWQLTCFNQWRHKKGVEEHLHCAANCPPHVTSTPQEHTEHPQ